MTTQVRIIDFFCDAHIHATTILVCSVYAVGFTCTCLGLLLAACHVGEDSDISPALLHQAQTIVVLVISLPTCFVHSSLRAHSWHTHTHTPQLKLWELIRTARPEVRRKNGFSFKELFHSQVWFQLSGCLDLMQLRCGIQYHRRAKFLLIIIFNVKNVFLLLISDLVITVSIKIWN